MTTTPSRSTWNASKRRVNRTDPMFRQHVQWHSAWSRQRPPCGAWLGTDGMAVAASLDVSRHLAHHPTEPHRGLVGGVVGLASRNGRGGVVPRRRWTRCPRVRRRRIGWVHFTGSTAGFLFAFPIGALVAGWFAEQVTRMRYGASALLLLLGQLVIVLLGLDLPTWHHPCGRFLLWTACSTSCPRCL